MLMFFAEIVQLLLLPRTRTKYLAILIERNEFPFLIFSPLHVREIPHSDYLFQSNPLTNKYCLPYLVTSSKTNDLIWWFIDSISLLLLPGDILLLISLSFHPWMTWWSLFSDLVHRSWRKHNRNNNVVMTTILFCVLIEAGIYTNNDNVVPTHRLPNLFTGDRILISRSIRPHPRLLLLVMLLISSLTARSTTIVANWVTNLGWTNAAGGGWGGVKRHPAMNHLLLEEIVPLQYIIDLKSLPTPYPAPPTEMLGKFCQAEYWW